LLGLSNNLCARDVGVVAVVFTATVAAHRATSVAVMMTDVDAEESAFSNGRIANSASLRTLLALRNLVYSHWHTHQVARSEGKKRGETREQRTRSSLSVWS
jgi:hypothetical protein